MNADLLAEEFDNLQSYAALLKRITRTSDQSAVIETLENHKLDVSVDLDGWHLPNSLTVYPTIESLLMEHSPLFQSEFNKKVCETINSSNFRHYQPSP